MPFLEREPRSAYLIEQAPGDRGCPVGCNVAQQHRELVTAESGDNVTGAESRAQRSSDL